MMQPKDLLPPLIYDKLRRNPFRRYGWFGNYRTWEEAKAVTKGYDAELILETVLKSTLKVNKGEYPYERDSVLFEQIQYDWPLLTGLLWVAAKNRGELNVLDYGGSLGSSYRQNKKFLDPLFSLRWNIIEQSNYVETGKKYIEDDSLRFFNTVQSCLESTKPNLILVSSVLNYINEPYKLLETLSSLRIPYMILERIPLIEAQTDRLTIQRVSPKIYDASYPAWFFSKDKFLQFIQKDFQIHEMYDCGIKLNIRSEMMGFVLKRKQ